MDSHFKEFSIPFKICVPRQAHDVSVSAVPILITLVSAAVDAIQKKSFADWQQSVTSKLNEIDSKLDVIIADLQALRGQIDADLAKNFVKSFSSRLTSDRSQIEAILAGCADVKHIPGEQIQRITNILADYKGYYGQLIDYGTWGFDGWSAAISGALGIILTYTFLPDSHGFKYSLEKKSFIATTLATYFKPAVDSNLKGSLQDSLTGIHRSIFEQNNQLDSLLGKTWRLANDDYFRRGPGPDGDPEYFHTSEVAYLSRTSATTFNVISQIMDNDQLNVPPYPGLNGNRDFKYGKQYVINDLSTRNQAILTLIENENGLQNNINEIVQVTSYVESLLKK